MKIYSDNAVTKEDLDTLSKAMTTKHSSEFDKFKMTMLALIMVNLITLGLVVNLYFR